MEYLKTSGVSPCSVPGLELIPSLGTQVEPGLSQNSVSPASISVYGSTLPELDLHNWVRNLLAEGSSSQYLPTHRALPPPWSSGLWDGCPLQLIVMLQDQ